MFETREKLTVLPADTREHKTSQLIGSYRIQAGHRVFEVDFTDKNKLVIQPAEFDAHYDVKRGKVYKIIQKQNCIYFSGLNIKSVKKQLGRYLDQKLQNGIH